MFHVGVERSVEASVAFRQRNSSAGMVSAAPQHQENCFRFSVREPKRRWCTLSNHFQRSRSIKERAALQRISPRYGVCVLAFEGFRGKTTQTRQPEAELPVAAGSAATGTIGYTVFTIGVALERSSARLFLQEKLLFATAGPTRVFVKTV
jgi:hypothetical protein